MIQQSMESLRSPILLALAVLATACSREVTSPGGGSGHAAADDHPVVTSQPSYRFDSSSRGITGEIAFRFTNVTEEKISLLNCLGGYGLWLEKWDGTGWRVEWSGVRLGCLSPPIEIAPGETLEDTLLVRAGAHGSNSFPQFRSREVAGTYRLVVGSVYWDYDHDGPPWGTEVPLAFRISSSFTVRTD